MAVVFLTTYKWLPSLTPRFRYPSPDKFLQMRFAASCWAPLYVQHSTPYPVCAVEALQWMDRKSSAPLWLEDLTTWLKYAWFVAALSTVELWTVWPSLVNLGMRALTTARLISLSRKPLYSAPYPAPVAVCPALTEIRIVSTSSHLESESSKYKRQVAQFYYGMRTCSFVYHHKKPKRLNSPGLVFYRFLIFASAFA